MKEFATDEEIKIAHDVLLLGEPAFEDDKIAVIKSNESRDIKACPGSGKTTVLLAKLSILSNRMPFEDGSGVCVLTHTNVAIEEIKARFGGKAALLFSYPNFCGTLQAFVDKFLAIPFFNSFARRPIMDINNERADAIIKKEFWTEFKTFGKENRKSLYSLVEIDNYKNNGIVNWDLVHEEIMNVVLNSFYSYQGNKFYRHYGDGRSIAAKTTEVKPRYTFLKKVRRASERQGVIKYEDAFSLAIAYGELLPDVKHSLSKRFKYVFIDEVQDSSRLQLDVIEKVFDRDKVVLQRFGDSCQAIYDNDGDCAWKPLDPLALNESKRFGESIAKVLRTVCIEDNEDLKGNPLVKSVKPIMLVYTDGHSVLPAFAQLLHERKINDMSVADIALEEQRMDALHRINIKAVGYVGKEKTVGGISQSIRRYFPQFENQPAGRHPFGENRTLNSFLQKSAMKDNPQEYRSNILDALLIVLERADIRKENGRRYSKISMLEYMENNAKDVYEKLNLNLAEWVLSISNSDKRVESKVFDSIKTFISTEMAHLFGFDAKIGEIRLFLKKEKDDFYEIKNEERSLNVYKDGNLEIEVATVHAVKGETHAATLFLETKNYKFESEHFGEQLCGVPYKHREGDGHVLPSLKVAYVAMSRPKYLLAYAIQKDRFEKIDCPELRERWDVEYV